MKPISRITTKLPLRSTAPSHLLRPFHSRIKAAANVAPIVGTGPPPEPPIPEARNATERLVRRKKQAEMLKNAKEIRSAKGGKGYSLKKRFWKHVSVEEVDGTY